MEKREIIAYCQNEVLLHDRERYMCVLLMSAQAQEALWVLLAWNLEVAKIADSVSQEMLGHIRFAWWREAFEELAEGKPVRQHIILPQLAEIITAYQLPFEPFLQIIEARAHDLEEKPFDSLEQLENYAYNTGGMLMQLWQAIAGEKAGDAESGKAWALIGILRSLHVRAHKGQSFLPDIDAQYMMENGPDKKLAQQVQAICSRANPQKGLFAVMVRNYKKRYAKAGYNPFSPIIEKGRATRALRLWLNGLFSI